jgi:hypothetical protein
MSLIQEELEMHQCGTMKPVKFWGDTDNDFHEIFDGVRWIKIKSQFQQPMGNRNKTTDNETEPEITPTKTEILV